MAVWYLLFSFPLLSLFFRFRGVVYLFLSLHYRRLSRTVRCLMCPCATPFPTTIFDVCSQLPAQLKNRHHDCRLRGCLVLEQKYVILPTCSTVTPTVKWQKRIFCKIFWFTTQRHKTGTPWKDWRFMQSHISKNTQQRSNTIVLTTAYSKNRIYR